ncbi:MAG: low-complexity tail membrane protein [Cyanobacteria bacterium P01_D01_bin.73]
MATHRKDPFLWFHLAALAAVPVGLEACALGFAAGDPMLPGSLDCLLVGILGAVPLLALQWFRPVYPFSVPLASLRPASLSTRQLRILTIASGVGSKAIALTSAVLGLFLLRLVYRWAPIAAEVTPFGGRLSGLGVAIAAFLLTSLWLQMGLGSALALAMPDAMINNAEPFPVNSISQGFFRWGIPLSRILPVLEEEEAGEVIEEEATEEDVEEEVVDVETDEANDSSDDGEGEEVEDAEAGDEDVEGAIAADTETVTEAKPETSETLESDTSEPETGDATQESSAEEPIAEESGDSESASEPTSEQTSEKASEDSEISEQTGNEEN